ncbi:MAG: YfdQ family protein [Donghicola eburneus]|nr:DUF2303 family protein [Donghicola eburneus]MCI5042086.1 YfdQ family protein [Donghicola eburneus]
MTAPFLESVPQKRDIKDLTKAHLEAAQFLKPTRRKGTAKLKDLDSFIAWSNRFKGETSALFADPEMAQPKLTCIADYHASGPVDVQDTNGDPTARHCHHRATYEFPLSDEWNAWMKVSGEGLDKDVMGEFIEAQAKDIMDPTPAILDGKQNDNHAAWENRMIETANQIEGRFGQLSLLLSLSRQFQVFETSDLKVATNRDTGEAEVQFLNEHKDAQGKKLNLPNLIIIAIPVFRGGAPYRMAVRFRYRKSGASVKFILTVYNPHKVFEAAFDEAVARATDETDLPTFLGLPEVTS